MNTKEKDLLKRDLSGRLPYGVKVYIAGDWFENEREPYNTTADYSTWRLLDVTNMNPKLVIKPYLRPMSSMTEEEKNELEHAALIHTVSNGYDTEFYKIPNHNTTDWLLEHHFDIRELITLNLALEAPEGMYD